MIEHEIRSALIRVLETMAVLGHDDINIKQDFLNAHSDLKLSDFSVDSLTTMELCIALELDFDVSILPEQLLKFNSLNTLVEYILESMQ